MTKPLLRDPGPGHLSPVEHKFRSAAVLGRGWVSPMGHGPFTFTYMRTGRVDYWLFFNKRRKCIAPPNPQAKSGITPQVHRAGRQAGAVKSVRRAGWEWPEGLLLQQRDAWAECTCAGARISIFLSSSFARARVSSILSPSCSATSRCASKCNTGSR